MDKDLSEITQNENASLFSYSCTVSDNISKVRKSGPEIAPKHDILLGAQVDGGISISMNSNEEISFVTPDSNAARPKMNLKNNLFVKRGAVPNTKLIYEDRHKNLCSPNQIDRSKEVEMSPCLLNQHDPAIYEVFRPLENLDMKKYNTRKEPLHLRDLSNEEQKSQNLHKHMKGSFGVNIDVNTHERTSSRENFHPNIMFNEESRNMFNHVPTITNDSKVLDLTGRQSFPKEVDVSKETLNPRNFYEDKDPNNDTLIIPDFTKENYKDQVFFNICNFAELPDQKISDQSRIRMDKEKQEYAEDVLGAAKNLIFSDLSLFSASNREGSISLHSEFMKYDTNKPSDKSKVNLEKEFGDDKSPILSFDSKSNFVVDEDQFSQSSSQDSVLYSPMNLSNYQLPADETEELRNSKILYESRIIKDKRVLYKPKRDMEKSPVLINQTPEILKKKSGQNFINNSPEMGKDFCLSTMVTAENNNKPFEYKSITLQNPLKESHDSSSYSRCFSKSSNMTRSRLESSKISPHTFSSNTKEENVNISSDSACEASENFDDVNEAVAYMKSSNLPEGQRSGSTAYIISPKFTSEESSKESCEKSEPLGIFKSFNDPKQKEMHKTQRVSTLSMKFKDLELNREQWRKNKEQQRLTKTFNKLSGSRNVSKSKGKLIVPKLRSTTPSHLFEGGCFRKDLILDKNEGNFTGRSKRQLNFSLANKGNFKFRTHSSNSDNTYALPQKSTVSIKSRNNRDCSASSVVNIVGMNNSRNASKAAKYKIIKKGYKTQREKRKISPSPTLKLKVQKKKKKTKKESIQIDKKASKKITGINVRRSSKSMKKHGTSKSRETSLNVKSSSKVLSTLMSKIKRKKLIRGGKSRAHSSELDELTHQRSTERTSYQSFKRSLSKNSKERVFVKRSSLSKHKKNHKTCGSSNTLQQSSKYSRNSSGSGLVVFQSHMLHPGNVIKQNERPRRSYYRKYRMKTSR
ncbi:unnamed protein product [Moneuplotes crassus]|uniref:Uncharacterized protein n=1 Tax=Euplotes crassus TaxID=5936 RepID=A0AAD1XZ53_EUPCR|nr:unnamed protein product [Moneuplotes crassus]